MISQAYLPSFLAAIEAPVSQAAQRVGYNWGGGNFKAQHPNKSTNESSNPISTEIIFLSMKKVIAFTLCVCLLALSYQQSRKFIELRDGRWVTIWKRYGDECLIIPGRYFGVFKPETSYLETKNTILINLFVGNSFPDTLVFRTQSHVEIHNESKGSIFLDYHKNENHLKPLIYSEETGVVNDDVTLLFVDIHDSVAMMRGKRVW
ncbi:MAG: hypothetical protein QM762_17950 [Chryseolinea sp.]